MSSLKDKAVIITGASSGIGMGTAIHLASLNCRLSLHGRNIENLEKTVAKCKEAGLSDDKICYTTGDLTEGSVAECLIKNTLEFFGRLDVLVNCAGILVPGPIENIKMEGYDHTMNVNVRSVVYLTSLAVPHLVETKGSIVNVSSVAGMRSFPNVLSYCMSKAAIDQFTRCTALELASKQVRVNAVNPGVILTEIHKRGGMSEEAYEKFLEHCKETHALGRPGTTDEVAKVISFLASDDSSFVTGATIPIDGGRHAMCPR